MKSSKEDTVEVIKQQIKEDNQFGDAIQLVVFRQGDEEYALQIDQIKEVVITPKITTMPQTPDYVKGVANIRGNVIAILDLEEKFGLRRTDSKKPDEGKNFTLVIESEEFKAGILVKEVPNTLAVRQKDIEESVNVVHDASMEQNYITGIVKREDQLIILIDILKVVHETDFNTVTKIKS